MISKDIFSNTYPIKKLGEVVIFLDSKRKPVKESERVTGIYPYYGANGLQGWINDYIFDDELILLAEDGGHFNNPDRGVAYKITGKTWVNNHAHVIKPLEDLNIDYLCRVLENYDLRTWITGTTRAKLTKGGASEILIPLPPLTEQKRIAQILDKADELRQKRQQSIEKLDELLQATFIDMFGDPVTNPKGWKVKKLADLGSIATGNTPPRANPENYGNFMEWIKSDNLNHSFDYATKATEYLSEIGAKKARVVPSGTILVTCIAGSFDCIGNLAIVDREVAFNQQINSLTPNDENDTLFLYYLLKISKHIIQSSSTKSMKGMISKSKFSEITLPIPPFEEQIKFSKVFENFNSLKKTALSQLEHQENLFQSLQQRAFNGEL